MADAIRIALDELDPGRGPICDLFAGSGTVSAALASSRPVAAADIQEFSRVLCSAILHPAKVDAPGLPRPDWLLDIGRHDLLQATAPLLHYEEECFRAAQQGNPELLCELIEASPLILPCGSENSGSLLRARQAVAARLSAVEYAASESRIFRNFGGLYFSYRQAAMIDILLTSGSHTHTSVRDTWLAAVISTASEIVNTVGKQFAQPIKPRDATGQIKRHLMAKILRDRTLDVSAVFRSWLYRYSTLSRTNHAHRVMRGSFASILDSIGDSVDVIYADPPYTREHYSRFYHVLETIALGDEPEISRTSIRSSGPRLARGMYRNDRHQSPFSIKSKTPSAFKQLFGIARDHNLPVLLSYSKDISNSVIDVKRLEDLARSFFNHVRVTSPVRITHSKLNNSRYNSEITSDEAELLFLCS